MKTDSYKRRLFLLVSLNLYCLLNDENDFAWNERTITLTFDVHVFSGVGKTHKDAASVRATHSIPAACGIYYFEVRIVSKGRDG